MRHARVAGLGVAAMAGLAASWLLAASISVEPAMISVRVGIQLRLAPAGTTLRAFSLTEDLHPRPGDLVSVTGRQLRPGIYPGAIQLDGRTAPSAVLEPGDRITVVDGRDRTEPVRTVVTPARMGQPSNPEYFLGRAPGDTVTVIGRISGEVASASFRPTGPTVQPHAVALTFDDGPWPVSTRAILRILMRKRAPATFFLIGEQAKARPDLVRAELAAHMEVGDHSWNHPLDPPLADLHAVDIRNEIAFTRSVETRLGVRVTAFRPPGGSWSDQVVTIAGGLGCRVVLWSVDPRDWAPGATARGIVRHVLSHVHPGSIILLHDGGGDRSATVRALPRIIDGIRRRGLRLTTIER
jgi:peptidoglycan-N-acetylglucosamine deacetylase